VTKKPYKLKKVKVDIGRGRKAVLEEAYSLDGRYIGSLKDAERFWKEYGIEKFELRRPSALVCSVGYSPRDKLWYGWSHRAIAGFKTRRQAAKFAGEVS